MVSQSWCIVMVVLACFQYRVTADCKVAGRDGESCHLCYQTLESYLLNTSDNKYQLRRVFYPLEVVAPVFVTVTYHYIGTNTTNLWFWSTGIFYFLQPMEVFQFTSLLFGNPSWRNSKINITLPSECVNASNEFMTELTQLVRAMNTLSAVLESYFWSIEKGRLHTSLPLATDLFSAPLNLRKPHCLPYISKSLNRLTRLSRLSVSKCRGKNFWYSIQ